MHPGRYIKKAGDLRTTKSSRPSQEVQPTARKHPSQREPPTYDLPHSPITEPIPLNTCYPATPMRRLFAALLLLLVSSFVSAQSTPLTQLASDFWAWRAQYRPFSTDDIPRIATPPPPATGPRPPSPNNALISPNSNIAGNRCAPPTAPSPKTSTTVSSAPPSHACAGSSISTRAGNATPPSISSRQP